MRNRLWYELTQAKLNQRYACLLIGYQRWVLNIFNIFIAVFSTAGVMGWKVWDMVPIIACSIISGISLLKLLQPHIAPSEKQIEKLDKVSDFYFDFYLKMERLWFDYEDGRISEIEMQDKFQGLKQTERDINKVINEIHKKPDSRVAKQAESETITFFNRAFNSN